MWSNGPGPPPKPFSYAQIQFDELLSCLKIPSELSSSDKLSRLRGLTPKALLTAVLNMNHHQFRPHADNAFVSDALFPSIESGAFATRLNERGVKLLIGECSNEPPLYSFWRPPVKPSTQSLRTRLEADYAPAIVDTLLRIYCPNGKLPARTTVQELFGKIYADMQVYALSRGFVDKLIQGGAEGMISRYRVAWRAKCADEVVPPQWGVAHSRFLRTSPASIGLRVQIASDLAIWFWGNGIKGGLTEGKEKELVRRWIEPLASFLNGDKEGWGVTGKRLRRLRGIGRSMSQMTLSGSMGSNCGML